MRRLGAIIAGLLLPLGLAMAAFVMWEEFSLRADAKKVDANWSPSGAVLWWARFWDAIYGIPWALHLAILHNEGASSARAPTDAELDALAELAATPATVYPIGDLTSSLGPSFGSGQVLKSNILKAWADCPFYLRPLVVAPAPEYLALPGHERQAMWASAQILAQALRDANGDLHDAARRYNGSGAAAEAYADRADAARTSLA